MNFPKYSQLEIERRWLVELAALGFLESYSYRLIEDLYVQESRLRLRKISSVQTLEYKLCKKYGKTESLSEPITNLYLSQSEYELLSVLPGQRSQKRRYQLEQGCVDVYQQPELDFAIFEIEFACIEDAMVFNPPKFVGLEITGDSSLSANKFTLE